MAQAIQRPSHNEDDAPLLKRWREAITTRLTAVIASVTTAEAEINALQADVTAAEADIVTAESNITTLLSERYNKTFGDPTELTIATGVITITQPYHTIDTEADAGTDDVDTINGGTGGNLLVLRAHEDARTVVLKNGTGNLRLGADVTLDSREDSAVLLYVSSLSVWVKISSSNNA